MENTTSNNQQQKPNGPAGGSERGQQGADKIKEKQTEEPRAEEENENDESAKGKQGPDEKDESGNRKPE